MHFLDRVSGDNLQPLHQCLILFRRDLQCLFFCTGPAETAKLQPFVEEKESIAFLSEYSDKEGLSAAFCYPHISAFYTKVCSFS